MKWVWAWIIIKDKRVLLIKRSKTKKFCPNHWVFPCWSQEKNETIEETAIREVKEETWLDFNIEKVYFEKIDKSKHYINYIWRWYGLIMLQEDECDWYWWFGYFETIKMQIWDWIPEILKMLYDDWLIE